MEALKMSRCVVDRLVHRLGATLALAQRWLLIFGDDEKMEKMEVEKASRSC